MKSFLYVIKDQNGMHARPLGLLVEEARKYESKIVIKGNNKSVEATNLMELMAMDIKWKDTVVVEVTGADEEEVCTIMKNLFEENV